jgi:hypothetical protein
LNEKPIYFEDLYLNEPVYGFDLDYDVPCFDEDDGEEYEGCPWDIPEDLPF